LAVLGRGAWREPLMILLTAASLTEWRIASALFDAPSAFPDRIAATMTARIGFGMAVKIPLPPYTPFSPLCQSRFRLICSVTMPHGIVNEHGQEGSWNLTGIRVCCEQDV
jgi:hypothetical protein